MATFLEGLDPKYSARYLEHLIQERGEESYQFHDRLVELYLRMTVEAKRAGDEGASSSLAQINIHPNYTLSQQGYGRRFIPSYWTSSIRPTTIE